MFQARRLKIVFQWLGWRQILILMLLGVGFFFFKSTTLNLILSTTQKLNSDMPICPKQKEDNRPSRSEDHGRRLAATIAEVQREIQRLAGTKASVDAKWALTLASVVTELDPRISLVNNDSSWDYSARIPGMGPASQLSNKIRHVCPEVYLGTQYAKPYGQHGMVPENCTYVPKFSNVLTAILPALEWEHNTANFVAQQIRKYYDIPIIAIMSSVDNIDENIKNIKVLKYNKKEMKSEILNIAVSKVKTPYLFIGKSMTHFNNQSSLERLVRVLDELEQVKVAGGAARDLQGHWIHGCLQQRMANYQVYYAKGYYHSKYECMYCDDLLTPFVTTKKLMTAIPITTGLIGPAMFRDWFAKVRLKGHLTMGCPDAMFYIGSHTVMNRIDWLIMSKQWALERVRSYDGQMYHFTCESVGISCVSPRDIIKSYLLPRCCKALIGEYLNYIIYYAKQHQLPYELRQGSELGAVKMDGYMPWDIDADITFECKDIKKWLEIRTFIKKKGCELHARDEDTYIQIKCLHFFVELYCFHYNVTSNQYLPSHYQSIPTTINFDGQDINVGANPALSSRNLMGIDDLKHAAHWRTLEVSSLGKAKGGYDNPGTWNPCEDPRHHSCLDHFPGDGNLPFHHPFLHL